MREKLSYLSASKLNVWETCRHQFYLSYIEKQGEFLTESSEEKDVESVEIADSVYLIFGTLVHKTLELFWKGEHKRNFSTLKKLYRECYIESGLNDPYYYNLGYSMMEEYFDYLLNEAPKRKLVGVEIPFDTVIGIDRNGDEVRSKGFIDACFYLGNGIYEIVDYKTSNYQPPQDEVDCNNQVALYDIVFRNESMKDYWYNGIKPKHIILTMHYLKFGSEGVMQTQVDKETRELNINYFVDSFEQMNNLPVNKYTANLNKYCNFCDVCDKCGSYKAALEDKSLEFLNKYDIDLFSDRIKAIEELNARIKILNSKISEYDDDCIRSFKNEMKKARRKGEERIVINGREYYMTNYTKRYLLPAVTIKILEKAGLWNAKEFIDNLPVSKIEKLCADNPEVWERIERKALKRYVGKPMLKNRKFKG